MLPRGHLRAYALSSLAYAPIGVGLKPTGKAASASGGGRAGPRLGASFERSIRDQLRRRGWFVMRSPGSKSPIDLIAIRKGDPVLWIQAKRTGVIGSTEWNEVFDIAEQYGGWPVLCMRASVRTTGFYRLDARREPRKHGRPFSRLDPETLDLL